MSQVGYKQPKIRIKDGWLLRENVSKHLHELWGKNSTLANDDWMKQRVEQYEAAWQLYEKKIILAMTDLLDLEFRQNIVDVYIAPWFMAFSDPLIIGVMKEPDEFIDVLTHELLHRLLTDNTSVPDKDSRLDAWTKMFGDHHSFRMLVHIPVHAVHKAIYLDVLEAPERLARDIAGSEEHNATDYLKAWDYVEKHGHQHIIDQLKNSYQDMRQTA